LGVSGPFESWPTGSGFERFYGTLSGEADLFAPALHDNTTLVDLPDDPNYYATQGRQWRPAEAHRRREHGLQLHGCDLYTPVTSDYLKGNNKFTGTINKVTIDLKTMAPADESTAEKAAAEADGVLADQD
jgi:hypothetical protein